MHPGLTVTALGALLQAAGPLCTAGRTAGLPPAIQGGPRPPVHLLFPPWLLPLRLCLRPGLSPSSRPPARRGGPHFLLSSSFRGGSFIEFLVHPFKFFPFTTQHSGNRGGSRRRNSAVPPPQVFQLELCPSERSHACRWVVWEGHSHSRGVLEKGAHPGCSGRLPVYREFPLKGLASPPVSCFSH